MLELQAEHDRRPIRDYASTLLAVILTDTGGVIGQIGGGGALIQEEDGAWRPIHWPSQGDYAHTTRFLTEADAFAAFQIAALPSTARRICLSSGRLERIVSHVRV
jgi:Protein phosphatase 2C